MSQFIIDENSFSNLQNKVIVITGGATGIGAAIVRILAKNRAQVVIGDVNISAAEELASQTTGVTTTRCDVTNYNDIYQLFQLAHEQHGTIHHAISCAGILEQGNWFDPTLTIDTIKNPGNIKVLEINLMGSLNFARIAAVFIRDGMQKGENRSITLLSSVNAFRDSPGLYLYQISKHGIQGLLRSTRKTLFERDGIRINAVCPGVTDTPMTAPVIGAFKDHNLFWQPPESVAKFVVALEATPNINGKAIYIEGNDGWEFEDSLYAAQPQWLGEEATRRMRVNAEAVNKGALVPKS